MMNQTNCQFMPSIKNEKKTRLTQFLIQTAMDYAMEKDQDIDPIFFFEEKLSNANSSVSEDELKLISLEFLKLVNMPSDELEQEYLKTIFTLESDDLMITQLEDFITNGNI